MQGYRYFLALWKEEKWTLNATKTRVGYPSCVFFGFEVDSKGTRLTDKNLDPIRRMVPPTNLPELRSTLGVFVQSARFIPRYAHIVAPLTALTRSSAGKPVPYLWDDTTQAAYDEIRKILLDGIHLSPPDYRLPFHGCGDASNDGKSFGLNQYNDLPPNTDFTVTAHSPTETTVQLTQPNRPHTIIHNDASRLHIAWWSKCWSDADRKRAPFYLEADTFLWGLAKSRFYALSTVYPLYSYNDHLPLKWVRKCDKGPVSAFTFEQLSDLSWVHTYIPGPQNTLYDGLSRYPLLGPRVLAPIGITQAVTTLLDYLPDSFRDSPKIRIFALPHTHRLAQQIQAWRRPTNPIDTHSFTHRSPPAADTSLVIAVPPPEDAPRLAARLLTTSIPFAVLLPAELAPRIADDDHFSEQPALAHLYQQGGKIMLFPGFGPVVVPRQSTHTPTFLQNLCSATLPLCTPARTLPDHSRRYPARHHCRMETSPTCRSRLPHGYPTRLPPAQRWPVTV